MAPASPLAILGGPKAVHSPRGDAFAWPLVTQEAEQAVLDLLRRGAMSDTDVTMEFEREFAAWQGTRYALGFTNGTMALQAAMFACGIGAGDEIICPSITYWASALPCFALRASVVFADIHPDSLCIDPADIERRITPRTRAIVVVHYAGHPADMDPIMAIARKHGIKVIEDVSHAHGGLYKGRKVGAIGDVSAMSMMSRKSFAIGEAGMLATDDREIYERAIAWGHYDRNNPEWIQSPDLLPFIGLPLGGCKGRMHQVSAVIGRDQLKHYDARAEEIRRAMNYFWDLLEGVPGLRAHRPARDSGSNMAGWYAARGHYRPEELGGLPVQRFAAAVAAEGAVCNAGTNRPLHLHPIFNSCDIFTEGRPTRIANAERDLRQQPGSLPVSEGIGARAIGIPWFKRYRPALIEEFAAAYRKVVERHRDLLDGADDGAVTGGWNLSSTVAVQ